MSDDLRDAGDAPPFPPDPSGQVITLDPPNAPSGDPDDITMVVTGRNFTEESLIYFNDHEEPTTLISDTQVSTGVKPSLFVVPAVCPVFVITGETATASADFTFTGGDAPAPPTPGDAEMLVTAQLRSWGISGEPMNWATPRMQPVLVPIRAYNLGFGPLSTVQGMLDITYPEFAIDAADVCIDRSSVDDPSRFRSRHVNRAGDVPAHDHVEVLDDLGLPAENVTWLLDTVIVGNGSVSDLILPPGEHELEVRVAIAGSVFVQSHHVSVPDEDVVTPLPVPPPLAGAPLPMEPVHAS